MGPKCLDRESEGDMVPVTTSNWGQEERVTFASRHHHVRQRLTPPTCKVWAEICATPEGGSRQLLSTRADLPTVPTCLCLTPPHPQPGFCSSPRQRTRKDHRFTILGTRSVPVVLGKDERLSLSFDLHSLQHSRGDRLLHPYPYLTSASTLGICLPETSAAASSHEAGG